MTRTDGERELVLGNKQLLSAFFVVVILLGVFFTMGYFVGKNTANGGFNSGPSVPNGGPRPDAVGKPLDLGSPATPANPPDSTASAADTTAGSSATPAPEASAMPVRAASTSDETKTATPPVERPPLAEKPESGAEPMAQPSAEQMYLQVSAVRRPDADNMVKVLRERGFPALLGESSKQGLYRVLVGPYKTTGELGRAKSDLKAKGFDSIVAK